MHLIKQLRKPLESVIGYINTDIKKRKLLRKSFKIKKKYVQTQTTQMEKLEKSSPGKL